MEFFNLGWSEILLILTLAFIVLGPDRIKKFGSDFGTFLRKLSKDGVFREVVQTTDELRNYPRKILNEAMLDQPVRYDEAEKSMLHPPEEVVDAEPAKDSNPDQPVNPLVYCINFRILPIIVSKAEMTSFMGFVSLA